MKILLISNSARGEAIADALLRSSPKPEVIAISTVRSPGLVSMCKEVHVMDIMKFPPMIELARNVKPDFAFISPDDPIGAGLADEFEKIGIQSVAPKMALAQIEASKGFARKLMEKHGIDASPTFRAFASKSPDASLEEEIRTYIVRDLNSNYVVKYDALKGGKGVKVSGEHLSSIDDGVAYAIECLKECGRVVLEEKLVGIEFSLMSFVSGKTSIDMPAVQDHKRAYEGDTGPNTGGMGTYSDSNHSLPFLTQKDLDDASKINTQVAAALMKECGEPYKGILYGGFIATKTGVKVIEYNARFGDPEVLNVLPLLESDFVQICLSIIDGTLSKSHVTFARKATVCKYITPKSYPDAKNEKGQIVHVPSPAPAGVKVYYGDVSLDEKSNILLGGSRSIGVVGLGKTLPEAEESAQAFSEKIHGPVRFRKDIGTADVLKQRVDMMKKLRA
jgi:phosphoribosylamine--glycine ligase